MINTFVLLLFLFYNSISYCDEIIKDINGDYFLIKKDGTFKKLPKPKAGNTYVIKKNVLKKKKEYKSIFTQPQKKARVRTNQGFK